MVEVSTPELGESVVEGTISEWLVAEGDRVQVDQPLVEITTDKVDAEIPSPVAGIIAKILVPEGATIVVGQVLVEVQPEAAPAPTQAALAAASTVRAMMGILGVDPLDDRWAGAADESATTSALDVLVQAELQRRADARVAKDWATADAVRDRLAQAGIEVTDTPDGAQWALKGEA